MFGMESRIGISCGIRGLVKIVPRVSHGSPPLLAVDARNNDHSLHSSSDHVGSPSYSVDVQSSRTRVLSFSAWNGE